MKTSSLTLQIYIYMAKYLTDSHVKDHTWSAYAQNLYFLHPCHYALYMPHTYLLRVRTFLIPLGKIGIVVLYTTNRMSIN